MIRKRSMAMALLSVMFAASIIAWLLYVPHRPDMLIRAIPPQATVISAHHDLASRFPELARNPLAVSLAWAMGIEAADLAAMTEDPAARKWIELFASGETLLAYIPAGRLDHQSCWVMASWVGAESQITRWRFRMFARHLDQIITAGGIKIWTIPLEEHPSGQQLYVAFGEGIALLVLAENTHPMRYMIEALERRVPSAMQAHPYLDGIFEGPYAPDRIWFPGEPVVRIDLEELSSDMIRGDLTVCPRGSTPSPTAEPSQDPVHWPVPMAFALVAPETVGTLLQPFHHQTWATITRQALRHIGHGPIMIAALDQPYQSRVSGFRLPGYLIARPVIDPDETLQAVREQLDRLNATYRAGLISHAIPHADSLLHVIVGVGDNAYAMKPMEEQMAYAVSHHWLLASGGYATVRRIIDDRFSTAAERSVWHHMARYETAGYAWMDLERSAQGLRTVLAALQLQLLTRDPQGSQPMRERIREVRDWSHTLSVFGEARFHLHPPEGDRQQLTFKIGPPAAEQKAP